MAKIIGMVGRNAAAKDWKSFAGLARRLPQIEAWGVGVSMEEAAALDKDFACVKWKGFQSDGRAWIRKLDLFVLTSKHEEMPTVVLECFAERTPICGFIPAGGMQEILSLSDGPLKDVFIEERDIDKLADIVRRIISDDDLRDSLVEDGWQILANHFDAEKNCREQLMDIYRRVLA